MDQVEKIEEVKPKTGRCPHCGSNDYETIRETVRETDGKNFNVCNALCGNLIFGVWGLLCGLCGTGQKTRTYNRETHICRNCGRSF